MPTLDIPALNAIFLVIDYAIKIVAVGVVPENRRPSSSTAWLLLILLVPILGLPLFLLLGSERITGRRHRIQAYAIEEFRRTLTDTPDLPVDAALQEELLVSTRLGRALTGMPATVGINHGIIGDYSRSMRRIIAAIDEAEHYVLVQSYIFALDDTTEPVVAALYRAKARGVTVRVLLDQIGSWKYPGYSLLRKRLDTAGIPWQLMLPVSLFRRRWRRLDLRNHRKLIVVDGARAFVGSLNLIEAEYQQTRYHRIGRQWVDLMIEVSGPVVDHIDALIRVDWFIETNDPTAEELRNSAAVTRHLGGDVNLFQVVPSGPGYSDTPNLRVFNDLIYSAHHRIRIVSPYFVPDESLLMAITSAALSGVRVELYVNERSDQFMVGHAQQSYYHALLAAGVRIYRYPAPYVLHSKFLIVDSLIAVLGSSNMDMRSFGLNYEVSLVATGGNVLEQLDALADKYLTVSSELTMEEWEQRPMHQRYVDSVFRLTSALQ